MRKKGGAHGKDPFQDSVDPIIQSNDLCDFKPKKGRYTWSNNRIGAANIAAHLNRFLVQSSLMDGKFIISSFILPKFSSNHHPISLKFEVEEDLGPIPFHFSLVWMTIDGSMELVAETWA